MNHWSDTRLTTQFYTKKLRPLCAKFELTQTQLSLFLCLANHPTMDTVKEISRLSGLSKSHISESIGQLIAIHFIEAVTDEFDSKIQHLRITPHGNEALSIIKSTEAEFESVFFDGFSDSQIQSFKQMLAKANANILNTTK